MDRRVPRATFLSATAILIYLGAAKLVIHSRHGRYGFFRDELSYIICGQRLAFGFVDHPPFTPLTRASGGTNLATM